jgi:hypothetical protein
LTFLGELVGQNGESLWIAYWGYVMEKWGIRINDLMTQAVLPMSDDDTAGG